MLDIPRLRESLLSALKTGGPMPVEGLVSVTLPAPWLNFQTLPLPEGSYHYWGRPQEEHYLLAIGECAVVGGQGEGRFGELKRGFERLARHWLRLRIDGAAEGGPLAALGVAFDAEDAMEGVWAGFTNSRVTVPRLLLHAEGASRTLTCTARALELEEPERLVEEWLADLADLSAGVESDPAACPMTLVAEERPEARAEWRELVEGALKEISGGGLEKVVVVRSATVGGERRFDAARLLGALTCMYPGCVLFSARLQGHTLIAATPERLVAVEGRGEGARVRADALAGTIRRSPEPKEDCRLAEALINDPKSRWEHQLVSDAVARALRRYCDGVSAPRHPRLLKLRNLQHLRTPFEGRMRGDGNLFELADALHPTPAVGGAPSEAAAGWLRTREVVGGGGRRGWYSGVVGWLSPEGEGELSVLLRCALLDGTRAHLFAGSGIVADSDPEAEWEESELKLAAMLRALENG